jgi:hypothetical protein
MKTFSWSGGSNTPKIPWYLANYGIQNRFFYMLAKQPSGKKYHGILQYHGFVSKL